MLNLTQNKMNLFVLSGHGSESFAAFLNGVILHKNNAAVVLIYNLTVGRRDRKVLIYNHTVGRRDHFN